MNIREIVLDSIHHDTKKKYIKTSLWCGETFLIYLKPFHMH